MAQVLHHCEGHHRHPALRYIEYIIYLGTEGQHALADVPLLCKLHDESPVKAYHRRSTMQCLWNWRRRRSFTTKANRTGHCHVSHDSGDFLPLWSPMASLENIELYETPDG